MEGEGGRKKGRKERLNLNLPPDNPISEASPSLSCRREGERTCKEKEEEEDGGASKDRRGRMFGGTVNFQRT